MYVTIYKTIQNKRSKNINKLTNVIYYYINICYNYHSIDCLTILLIYSLTFIYRTYFSYLVCIQTATAIWSGKFLVFDNILGRQLVRHSLKDYFVLFCFVLFWCYSCVYNTNKTTKVLFTDPVSTTAELDLLIRILSSPNKILCVLLVIVTILTTFTLY